VPCQHRSHAGYVATELVKSGHTELTLTPPLTARPVACRYHPQCSSDLPPSGGAEGVVPYPIGGPGRLWGLSMCPQGYEEATQATAVILQRARAARCPDYSIHPTRSRGYGRSSVEAMEYGIPLLHLQPHPRSHPHPPIRVRTHTCTVGGSDKRRVAR